MSVDAAKVKELRETGIISRAEVEKEEVKLADAQRKLAETQKDLAGADLIISEALEADEAVRAAAPRRGYAATSAVLRYRGGASWNIANIASVSSFFASRFGRAIPISASRRSRSVRPCSSAAPHSVMTTSA